jgi:hypothetical protein
MTYNLKMRWSSEFRDIIRREFELDYAPDMGKKFSDFQAALVQNKETRELADTRIFTQD